MITINIRELTHHFSGYLQQVKEGEHITILERNIPVAEIVPHNPNMKMGWKRKIKRMRIKGFSFSKSAEENRKEGR